MRKALWILRAKFKSYVCRMLLIIEYCHTCGRRQPLTWWAPDEVWNRLMPGSGIICPECFDRLARKAGIALRWMPTVEYEFSPRPAVKRATVSASAGAVAPPAGEAGMTTRAGTGAL